jgi:hypothetical protein
VEAVTHERAPMNVARAGWDRRLQHFAADNVWLIGNPASPYGREPPKAI